MSDSRNKYEENLEINKEEYKKASENDIDIQNINTFLGTSLGGEVFSFSKTKDNLLNDYEEHLNNLDTYKIYVDEKNIDDTIEILSKYFNSSVNIPMFKLGTFYINTSENFYIFVPSHKTSDYDNDKKYKVISIKELQIKLEKGLTKNISNELLEAARNKRFMGSEVGAKYSDDKAPITSMLNQFNLALEAVAMRSKEAHEGKYKDVDQDWMNFKRVPNAIEQYSNGTGRHLMYLGDDENKLGHEVATAWNALARLQIILENKTKND